MYKLTKGLVLAACLSLLVGCSNQTTLQATTSPQPATSAVQITSQTSQPETTISQAPQPETSLGQDETYSRLNGQIIHKDQDATRPLVVMVDNHNKARPQSGLSYADVVYEIMAEGNITRLMAVFQSAFPDQVGPVRSARPYFIKVALGYDPYYVHVGGSDQAFMDIKALGVASLDLRAGYSVIRQDRKAPHSTYTTLGKLSVFAQDKGYKTDYDHKGYTFGTTDMSGGQAYTHLSIRYRQAVEGKSDAYYLGYLVDFVYNEETGRYMREINQAPHVDDLNGDQLYADSIIVLKTSWKAIDSDGRLDMKVLGSGQGFYLVGGQAIPIKWEKQTERDQLVYYHEDSEELVLQPGKLWIQVVASDYQL